MSRVYIAPRPILNPKGGGWSVNHADAYYAEGGDVLDITTDDFEIGFWFRQNGAPISTAVAIAKSSSPFAGTGWSVYLHSNGWFYGTAEDAVSGNAYFNFNLNAAGFLDNAWHHIHLFFDRSAIATCEIWVDGVSKTIALSGTMPLLTLTNASNLTIGTIGPRYWEGHLRDIRLKIGGTKTSQAQILYQVSNPLDYSASSWTLDGTREAWQMTEGTGTTLTAEVTTTANDLTLSNALAWEFGNVPTV